MHNGADRKDLELKDRLVTIVLVCFTLLNIRIRGIFPSFLIIKGLDNTPVFTMNNIGSTSFYVLQSIYFFEKKTLLYKY